MKEMNLFGKTSQTPPDIYYIKNKDAVLGSFQWESPELAVLLQDNGLPSFVSKGLNAWLEGRTPAKYRAYAKELLQTCGLTTIKDVIDYAKSLSLNDTLWVTRDTAIKWEGVSLFKNPFDDVIARAAFDGSMLAQGSPKQVLSPEFSTDGMLAKCWVRESDGTIQLYKAGTQRFSNAGKEPYSEVMAHQILSRLGYNHVPYKLSHFHKKLVSVCPLFTTEGTMYLPVYKYFALRTIEVLMRDCVKHGIGEALAQHLIYDYLSWNTDRHAGNFGVLLDSDTFELKGMAPIFDNGCSMLAYWNGTDDLRQYITNSTPALYASFEMGAQLGKKVLDKNHNVQRLVNFKFDRSELEGFDEKRLCAIEDWLQGRVRWFLELP